MKLIQLFLVILGLIVLRAINGPEPERKEPLT
jgi:hypothetical protein